MNDAFHSEYPSIEHLREKARQRMPGFAFDYLESGCNSAINLARNTADIRDVQLRPYYIGDYAGSSLRTELFGATYDAEKDVSRLWFSGG